MTNSLGFSSDSVTFAAKKTKWPYSYLPELLLICWVHSTLHTGLDVGLRALMCGNTGVKTPVLPICFAWPDGKLPCLLLFSTWERLTLQHPWLFCRIRGCRTQKPS